MCDRIDVHNALSPALSKIETLARLSPLGASDRETLQVALTLLDMVGDYAQVLRQTLDALGTKEAQP